MGWVGFGPLLRSNPVIFGTMATSSVAVAVAMYFILEQWRETAEIKPPEPKTQYITQDTEDALTLNTLSTLIDHYNPAIRDTAARIVIDRALNDGSTLELLLWGITRPDYGERVKHLRALHLIMDAQHLQMLHTWKAYSALIRCLELSLDPDQETLNDDLWDDVPLRDISERLCLAFINQLIGRYGAEKLIKAGFVEKWLAKQNWGATEEERQANFFRYMQRKSNRISDIAQHILRSDAGRAALFNARLTTRADRTSDDVDDRLRAIFVSITGEDSHIANVVARPLSADHRRRQRHREAFVMNDGEEPLVQGNITEQD